MMTNFKITQTDNFILGYNGIKPIVGDLTFPKDQFVRDIVIFCHGYKGFKDWGAWNLVANEFALKGFAFLKFNFSHNGGTLKEPVDFPDLDAFGHDNYSKQLEDIETVISFIQSENDVLSCIDTTNITLIGHSRGGGISCIATSKNHAIKKLITWAGISNYHSRFPIGDKLVQWKEEGVLYVKNGRTKQDMPHYFQFYEDYIKHLDVLNIKKACKNLKQEFLIIHGQNDETVNIKEAKELNKWCKHSVLNIIKSGTHTFNTYHPWSEKNLSKELKKVVNLSINFIKNQSL